MAYIRFKGETDVHKASVFPNGNLVTIKFFDKKEINTNGFNVYLDEKCDIDIGGSSYMGFNTIYRNDETTEAYNGYQLSNDGSVYIEPIFPVQTELTLEEVKASKIVDMNSVQQVVIQSGIDVTLSNGATEHFTLSESDQASLMGLQAKVIAGDEAIPWHTSDETEHCKYYSNTDMAIITETALSYVAYHVTYFRDLRIYINSLQTKEEVEGIFYGIIIPEEYQSEPLKDMVAAINA